MGEILRGDAPDSLLGSYHAERHPVAARVLRAAAPIRPSRRPTASPRLDLTAA
jgi:hypothetical protein